MRVEDEASGARALRYNLAVQRTRLIGYSVSFVAFLIGMRLGVLYAPIEKAITLLAIAIATVVIPWIAYLKRVDKRLGVSLTPAWLFADLVNTSLAVWWTGGIVSPWYIWYIAIPASAAFSAGRRAAIGATLGIWAFYVGTLALIGDVNSVTSFSLASCRMFFLAAASLFAIRGILKLQEKHVEIAQLRVAEGRKLQELTELNEQLTHLATELDQRTRELALSNDKLREASLLTQEHDRLKSEFLANMSHELRTPLNAIIGFAEILADRLKDDIHPRYVGFLNSILGSGQHLLSVINDVLDLSKIEAGKMDFYPEPFNVRKQIEAVCNVVRGTAAKRGIIFDVESDDDLPLLTADPSRFNQILYNLLSNAVKFSPMGGTVTIRAFAQRDEAGRECAAVSVIDRGIGIAPEHREVIFEEFRQVEGTTTRGYGGTGLGLALVRRFVNLQGGRVFVQSELGRGSTFTFLLPIVCEVPQAAVRELPPARPPVSPVA